MLFLATPVWPVFVKGVALQESIRNDSAEILSFSLQVLEKRKIRKTNINIKQNEFSQSLIK